MIPPFIHQTWRDSEIPHNIYPVEWQQSWRIHHSDWSYQLWTDMDLESLARKYLPEYQDQWRCWPGIVRADLGRYLILYEVGGIYADLDYECYRSLSLLAEVRPLLLSWSDESSTVVNNALLGATAGHHFFITAAKQGAQRWAAGNRWVEAATGPLLLTSLIDPSLEILPAKLLCPIQWTKGAAIAQGTIHSGNITKFRETAIADGAYCGTYWCHNW